MKPFIHTHFVGDFFTVLQPVEDNAPTITARKGATQRQDAVALVLSGELDLDHLPDLAASLRDLLTNAVRLIVLDLSRVSALSPNAAGILVNFVGFAEGGGKKLILFRPSQCVTDTFENLGLMHFFEFRQSEEELLLALPEWSE